MYTGASIRNTCWGRWAALQLLLGTNMPLFVARCLTVSAYFDIKLHPSLITIPRISYSDFAIIVISLDYSLISVNRLIAAANCIHQGLKEFQ